LCNRFLQLSLFILYFIDVIMFAETDIGAVFCLVYKITT
jgi:hypothetical protein